MSLSRPTIISLTDLEQAALQGSELAINDRTIAATVDPYGNYALNADPTLIGRMEPPTGDPSGA